MTGSSDVPGSRVDVFRRDEVGVFLDLAAQEGWLCDRWEFEFLLDRFPRGCLAVRLGNEPVAFVTSIKYGTSGWIGNLIVRHDLRGRGIGSDLMRRALDALDGSGVRTVWLTASEEGRPIYERLGFSVIDMVERWRGQGRDGEGARTMTVSFPDIVALDGAGWGDDRESLLSAVLERSEIHGTADGFLFIQHWQAGYQLGPWSASSETVAAELLDRAIARLGRGAPLFLDVPTGNVVAKGLLAERRFSVTGRTTLMYRGEPPRYNPGAVFALASMGSMG